MRWYGAFLVLLENMVTPFTGAKQAPSGDILIFHPDHYEVIIESSFIGCFRCPHYLELIPGKPPDPCQGLDRLKQIDKCISIFRLEISLQLLYKGIFQAGCEFFGGERPCDAFPALNTGLLRDTIPYRPEIISWHNPFFTVQILCRILNNYHLPGKQLTPRVS